MTNKPITFTAEEPRPPVVNTWLLVTWKSQDAWRYATEDDLRLAGFTRSTREAELVRANEDAWHRVAQLEAERDEAIARAETAMATELLAARRRIRLLESRAEERDRATWDRAQRAQFEDLGRHRYLKGGAPCGTYYQYQPPADEAGEAK